MLTGTSNHEGPGAIHVSSASWSAGPGLVTVDKVAFDVADGLRPVAETRGSGPRSGVDRAATDSQAFRPFRGEGLALRRSVGDASVVISAFSRPAM